MLSSGDLYLPGHDDSGGPDGGDASDGAHLGAGVGCSQWPADGVVSLATDHKDGQDARVAHRPLHERHQLTCGTHKRQLPAPHINDKLPVAHTNRRLPVTQTNNGH